VGWLDTCATPGLCSESKSAFGRLECLRTGAVFSVAICPICTPALVVLLGATVGLASPWVGAALLLAFAAERALPVAIGAVSIGWLENLRGLDSYRRVFETAGGIVLILSGLYMLNAYFFWLPALAG
jgi:cytochrome c-type biogenesis protein